MLIKWFRIYISISNSSNFLTCVSLSNSGREDWEQTWCTELEVIADQVSAKGKGGKKWWALTKMCFFASRRWYKSYSNNVLWFGSNLSLKFGFLICVSELPSHVFAPYWKFVLHHRAVWLHLHFRQVFKGLRTASDMWTSVSPKPDTSNTACHFFLIKNITVYIKMCTPYFQVLIYWNLKKLALICMYERTPEIGR